MRGRAQVLRTVRHFEARAAKTAGRERARQEKRNARAEARGRETREVDTGRAGITYRTMARIYTAYAKSYFRATLAGSRRQEYAADAAAARIAGRDATASALREIPALDAAFGFYMECYAMLGTGAGVLPPRGEVFGGFGRMLDARELELAGMRLELPADSLSPYDSHPPIADRVRRVEALPADGRAEEGKGAALDLLTEPRRTLAALEEAVLSDEALALRRAGDWQELLDTAMGARLGSLDSPLHRALAMYTRQPPTLPALLKVIDDGQLWKLARRLPMSDEAAAANGRVFREFVRPALWKSLSSMALADLSARSRLRWEFSWSEAAAVRLPDAATGRGPAWYAASTRRSPTPPTPRPCAPSSFTRTHERQNPRDHPALDHPDARRPRPRRDRAVFPEGHRPGGRRGLAFARLGLVRGRAARRGDRARVPAAGAAEHRAVVPGPRPAGRGPGRREGGRLAAGRRPVRRDGGHPELGGAHPALRAAGGPGRRGRHLAAGLGGRAPRRPGGGAAAGALHSVPGLAGAGRQARPVHDGRAVRRLPPHPGPSREEHARAAALAPEGDPGPYVGEIWTAIGLGCPHADMDLLWKEITERAPYHYEAHFSALQYWCGKWRGSEELARAFAARAARNAPPGSLMTALPLIAHFEHDESDSTDADRTPEMHALVDAALADAAAADPDHPRLPEVRHLLAYYLSLQDRDEAAVEQFRLVDGHVGALPWRYRGDPAASYCELRDETEAAAAPAG